MKKVLIIVMSLSIFSLFPNESIKESITKHLNNLATDAQNGRAPGSKESREVAEYIKSQFSEIGLETSYQTFGFNNRLKNVIGVIPSNNGKYIVIGAHYDHLGSFLGTVYNGADDNASGVSAIIEISRQLIREKLQYGIVFVAFDAEESGLNGSRYFVNNTDYKIDLMLSLDMVGHLNHEARLIYEGAATIINGEKFLENSEVDNISVKTYPVANHSGVLTDTFYFSKKNIPAMNVYTGLETSNYHKPTDDIETLDIDGMVQVVKQVSRFITDIQGDIEPSGINIYGNHKQRFGIAFSTNGITINGMTPVGYSLYGGEHYFKYGLEYLYESEKKSSVNTPVGFLFSFKILGFEIGSGAGIYGSININKLINEQFEYQAGFYLENIFNLYNNISYLNSIFVSFDYGFGYKNFLQEGITEFNKIPRGGLKFGFYF